MVLSKKESFQGKLYTFITVLCPFLMMYNFGIATMTILDAVIVCWYIVFLFVDKDALKKLKLSKLDLVLLTYIFLMIINFLISSLYREVRMLSVLFRMVRLIVYLMWTVVGAKKYLNETLALDMWKLMCIFATAYLFLQYIFLALFNISIPGYLPFLDVARDELITFTEKLYFSSSARPRSIFAEPSQYGIYLTGFLSVAFLKKEYKVNGFIHLLLYAGMILSSSTAAFMGIFITAFLYITNSNRSKALSRKVLFILVVSIVFFAVFIFKWSTLFDMIEKIFVRMPSSIHNRISGWIIIINKMNSENILMRLFGFGMDVELINSLEWTSSVLKIVFYFGYLGISIFMSGVFYLLHSNKKNVIYYILIIVLLGMFTELLVSNWMVLFLPFIEVLRRNYKNTQGALTCE